MKRPLYTAFFCLILSLSAHTQNFPTVNFPPVGSPIDSIITYQYDSTSTYITQASYMTYDPTCTGLRTQLNIEWQPSGVYDSSFCEYFCDNAGKDTMTWCYSGYEGVFSTSWLTYDSLGRVKTQRDSSYYVNSSTSELDLYTTTYSGANLSSQLSQVISDPGGILTNYSLTTYHYLRGSLCDTTRFFYWDTVTASYFLTHMYVYQYDSLGNNIDYYVWSYDTSSMTFTEWGDSIHYYYTDTLIDSSVAFYDGTDFPVLKNMYTYHNGICVSYISQTAVIPDTFLVNGFQFFYITNIAGYDSIVQQQAWRLGSTWAPYLYTEYYYGCTQYLGIAEPDDNRWMHLYPNPTVDQLTISLPPEAGSATLTIYNTDGQILLSQPAQSGDNILSVKQLPAGIYMVYCRNPEGSNAMSRFVKV